MKTEAPTFEDLIKHIENDETVKWAVTESIHRFYYDKCFDPITKRPWETEQVRFISGIHNYFSRLYAGWRHKIKKQLERYHGWEDTIAVYTDVNANFKKNNL